MRHRKGNAKLGLPTDQRIALIKNGTKSLFLHGKITTTSTRAKAISMYAERLITKAKGNDLHAIREVSKAIGDKAIVKSIMEVTKQKYLETNGGYTRITKLGIRRGDAASVSVLELV